MKKLLSLLFALIILSVLVACDSTANKKDAQIDKETEIVETNNEEIESSEAKSTAGEQVESSEEENTVGVEIEEEVRKVDIPLIENESCSIKVTEIEPDYEFGYRLGLSMANSSEVSLYFTTENTAIDNLAVSGYFGEQVDPGQEATGEIVFRKENCELAGRLDYSDILLELKVCDYDDSQNIYAEEVVHIYPEGEENAVTYRRNSRRGDRVLINSNDLKFTLINFDEDENNSFADVYLENNSEEEIFFSCKDVSVNDCMISTNFYVNLLPGHSGYAKINWAKSALQESKIERVRYVNLTLYARPADTYDNIFEETFFLRA